MPAGQCWPTPSSPTRSPGLVWLPYFLSLAGLGLLPVSLPTFLVLLGQYGPTSAAFILVAATGGRPALRHLLRRYGQWRVHIGWYLFVIVGPLALLLLTLIGSNGTVQLEVPGLDGPSIVLEYLIFVLVLKLVFGGALGEEAGWRGFALLHGGPGCTDYLGPVATMLAPNHRAITLD